MVWADGVEDLAAQYIAEYKKGAGGVYIEAADSPNHEYMYEVIVHETDAITVSTFENDENVFEGMVEKFMTWAEDA